jgi:hypothetical protein
MTTCTLALQLRDAKHVVVVTGAGRQPRAASQHSGMR